MENDAQSAPLEIDLKRESTADQVASALYELIVDGRIAPGTHLAEGPTAEQLGVSRNTVREATLVLVGRGLVRREVNRGAFVAELTTADVHDIYRVRRLVEQAAIEDAPDAGQLDVLEQAVQKLSRAIEAGSASEVAEADLAFHGGLIRILGSSRLSQLFASVETETRLGLALAGQVNPGQVLADHRRLLAALLDGQMDQARKILADHLDAGEKKLIAWLDGAALGDH
jgi:DNA-binding GntR family transcriptional regulator